MQVLDGATDKYLSWTNDGCSFLWHPGTDPIKAPIPLYFDLPFVTDVARVDMVSGHVMCGGLALIWLMHEFHLVPHT